MQSRHRYLAVTLLAVCGLVLATCLSVFALPQLEADDYRYLALADDVRLGRVSWLTAATVENRWDHLWWIDTQAVVRFFRPTVILSFLVDAAVHGSTPAGLLASNLLLHLACCLVVTLLLFRLLGTGLGPSLASLLFAAFSCHAETIWYVSGRTDTLAALGFLVAMALHTAGRRWLALPCFAFALASKELTAALPLVLFAYDRFVARRHATALALLRRDLALWLAYAALLVAFFLVRRAALGPADSGALVYPYFVAPSRPDFAAHVWAQLRNYAENLLCGAVTPPFLRPDQVPGFTSPLGLAASITAVLFATLLLRREPAFWLLAFCALATWLPTSFVYVSERYLYLPSFAVAGIAGLLWQRAPAHAGLAFLRPRWVQVVLTVALGAWAADQAARLHFKNSRISRPPREAFAVSTRAAEVREAARNKHRLLLLGPPIGLLQAQFLEAQLRYEFRDPDLVCRILTVLPLHGTVPKALKIDREGARTLTLRGDPVLMRPDQMLFPWRRLDRGAVATHARLGFRAEVVEGSGDECAAVRFTFAEDLETWTVVAFVAPIDVQVPPQALERGRFILACRMQVLQQ